MSDAIVLYLVRALGLDPLTDVGQEVEIAVRLGAARPDATLDDVARRVGSSREALKSRFKRRRLPSPTMLLRWGRVLAAMAHWRAGATLEETASAKGWRDAPTISSCVRRASGMWPTEWSGDLPQLAQALIEQWQS